MRATPQIRAAEFFLFAVVQTLPFQADKSDRNWLAMHAFFDDLTDEASKNKCEKQADKMASETLIPASEWKTAGFRRNTRTVDITAFAERLRISPAIPAGRIRYEARDFAVFKPLIGAGKLRKMFGMKGT